jgi:hypothetical protein
MPPVVKTRTRDDRRVLADAWLQAALEARAAYENWSRRGDDESYAVYLASADQADAAQDALGRSRS